MRNTYTTIRTYYDSINAHLDKVKLEAAGLDCILLDEQINDLRPNWAIILVNLLVREEDVEAASEVLCASDYDSVEEIKLKESDLEVDSDFRNAS